MKKREYLISINKTRRVRYVFLLTSSYTSRNFVRCHTFPVNVIYAWYINLYCPRPDLKRIPPGFYNRKCGQIFTKLGDLLQTFHCLLDLCLPLTKSGSSCHAKHFGLRRLILLYLRCLHTFPCVPDSSQPVSQTQSGMDRLNCNYINQGKQ